MTKNDIFLQKSLLRRPLFEFEIVIWPRPISLAIFEHD